MIWRLEVRTDDSAIDALVDAELESSPKELVEQLRRHGVGDAAVRFRDVDVTDVETIAELGLHHGAVLDATAAGSSDRSDDAGNRFDRLHLVVLYGPDAGRSWALTAGTWLIGRSESADLRIADPLMSARHAEVTVTDHDGTATVEITDLDSTNGSAVEDVEFSESREWALGTYVQLGASVLVVTDVAPEDRAVINETGGPDVALQRRFRQADDPLPRSLKPPIAPTGGEVAAAAWWRSLMPLITGAGFAYLTGRWEFLLVMALAPILFTVDVVRRRRKKRAADAAAMAAHDAECARFERTVTDLRARERARRRVAALGGGDAAFMSSIRHRRLWERSATDDDFGSVSVGLASIASDIDAGDRDEVNGSPRQWGTPVQTSLVETGSVSVRGRREQTDGVLRSMMLGLATAHSPADLRLWLFADTESVDDWRFARWLPHAFSGPDTSSIACEAGDRAALFAALKQELETRLDRRRAGANGVMLPLHVAVFSRADLVADADLADLLTRGVEVGISAIVADPAVTPEGASATLTLAEAVGAAQFESLDQPLLDGVITAQIAPEPADRAARRLAPLRPAIDERGGGAMGDVVHLTDMLGIDGITPNQLGKRWEQLSPQTAATIGVASDTPMVIDIAEHGPHGLVGGMSGSGKTEFLMTLLTSLCLNNHPDDLAIAIVDFKGGVDHALTSQLPHVIGLSTNLEIEDFARTIDLLDAEQRRRQALLAGVGGDLDAYRTARLSRPELPPLPRLLVVVDEFSELLASEDGKQRLQELVRVTRIGRALGVHLLLVTQNFEGQLPPQVEANAGLRVCLRVMKPGHSKVVLDSDAAANIADSAVGRAFARLNGRDLVEFQTARVAGRRRDLSDGPAPVTVRRSSISSLCRRPEQRREGKPPSEETDMHALIATLWDAAEASGWSGSAVPWPGELPADLGLRSLLDRCEQRLGEASHGVPIALQDRPDEQTQTVLSLSPADEQIVLLGGPSADLVGAQTAMAASLSLFHSPDEHHVHVIDLEGGELSQLGALPHCGTVAVRDDAMSLRLLRHLLSEVAERRAAMVTAGVARLDDLDSAACGSPDSMGARPSITLFVSGADRLVRRGDDGRSPLLAPLLNLLADAPGTALRIVLAGLPSIADSRLGQNIERRFVFAMPGEVKAATYGVPRELGGGLDRRGRCVDVNHGRLTQFASIDDVRQLGERLAARVPAALSHPPKTFVNVTWPFSMRSVDPASLERRPDSLLLPLPVGVDVDTGDVAWVDAGEDGPVFAVAGGRRSGRSTALASIATMASRAGWQVIAVAGSRRSPLAAAPAEGEPTPFAAVCTPDRLRRTLTRVSPARPTLLVFDDLHRVSIDDLDLDGVFTGERRVAALIAGPVDFLSGRDPVLKAFPAPTSGLLLAPTGFADGAAVGMSGRLSDEQRANPRPGRGLLAVAGEARVVQIPT